MSITLLLDYFPDFREGGGRKKNNISKSFYYIQAKSSAMKKEGNRSGPKKTRVIVYTYSCILKHFVPTLFLQFIYPRYPIPASVEPYTTMCINLAGGLSQNFGYVADARVLYVYLKSNFRWPNRDTPAERVYV